MMMAATSHFKFVYVAFGLLLCVDMSLTGSLLHIGTSQKHARDDLYFKSACYHLVDGSLKVVMLGSYRHRALLITSDGQLFEEASTALNGGKETFKNKPISVATKWPRLIEKAGQPGNWKGASVFKHLDGNVYLAVHIDAGHYVLQNLDEKSTEVIKFIDGDMDGTLVSSDHRAQVIRRDGGVACLFELKVIMPSWFNRLVRGHEPKYERDNKRCSKVAQVPSIAFEVKNKIYAINPSEAVVHVFEATGGKFELTQHKIPFSSFFSCGSLLSRWILYSALAALVLLLGFSVIWCLWKFKAADDNEKNNEQLDSPMSSLTPASSIQGASLVEPSMRPSSKALQSNQAPISAGVQPTPVSSQPSGHGQSGNWPSNAPSMGTSTFSQGPSIISATSSFNTSAISNMSQASSNTSNLMGSSMANSSAALPSGVSNLASNVSTRNSSTAQSNVFAAPSNASNVSKATSNVGKGRSRTPSNVSSAHSNASNMSKAASNVGKRQSMAAGSNVSSVPGSRTPASSAIGGSTTSNALKPDSSAISSLAGSSAIATSVTRPK